MLNYLPQKNDMVISHKRVAISLFLGISIILLSCALNRHEAEILPGDVSTPAAIQFLPFEFHGGRNLTEADMKKALFSGALNGMEIVYTGSPFEPFELKGIANNVDYKFTARLFDAKGKILSSNPLWQVTNPDIINVMPASGNTVIVRGIKEGVTDIIIEAVGIKKIIKALAVSEIRNNR